MFSYLNKKKKQASIKLKKKSFSYFYWKYIYGDIIISKFINSLVKSGKKNRSISIFLKALSNMKNKFGINPILLVKYIILKRNVLHKITKKRMKKKTFYYLRVLDFEKQISSTIKKIMKLVFYLKEKKKLRLWQSVFLVLLNFCVLKTKRKKVNISIISISKHIIKKSKKILTKFLILRKINKVRLSFIRFYSLLKNNIFRGRKLLIFLSKLKKSLFSKMQIELIQKDTLDISIILFFYKIVNSLKLLRNYLSYSRLYLSKKISMYKDKIKVYIKKIILMFKAYKKLKKRYLLRKIKKFKKFMFFKKQLSKNKKLLNNRYKKHFLTRFFFKELRDFKKASKFKNSFLNFKLRNKKRKELSMGTRIHSKYDVRLRHRKIFFRVSKHGQLKK